MGSNEALEIEEWLKKNGLECYAETFLKENIDLETLKDLDEQHLKELGVSIGHRIKLRKAISEIQEQGNEETQVMEYTCKVIVVGEGGTGKTSLIERYTTGSFEQNYKATIGVDFSLKEIQLRKDVIVNLQLWDIGGQERFVNLTRMYYKEACGALVVFDVSRKKTLDKALTWKADIDSKVTLPSGEVIPVILVGNKCDVPKFDENFEIDEFCKANGFLKGFFTSAKDNIGVNDAMEYLVQYIFESQELQSQPVEHESQTGLRVVNHDVNPSKKNSKCCQN